MTLLHIFSDDKFIDSAIEVFEKTHHVNCYLCLREEEPLAPYKYIKQVNKVKSIQPKDMAALMHDERTDIYCFHALSADAYDYVLQIPESKKIIWLAWGYDLYKPLGYSPAVYPLDLYKPLTMTYLGLNTPNMWKKMKRSVKKCMKCLVVPQLQYAQYRKDQEVVIQQRLAVEKQEQVLQRIDYLSTVLPTEYELIKQYRGLRAEYFPFQYMSQKVDKEHPMIDTKTAEYILIGNSATPTNNHLDVVALLRSRGICNPLYVPLAYGVEYYQKYLMNEWKGDEQFTYQTEFCDEETYRKILRKCRVAIFGHIRQQALGNIIIAMQQGSKVFMYQDSMAYQFYKRCGCVVYSIENELTPEEIAQPMALQDIQKNIDQIYMQFGFENVVKRLNAALDQIELCKTQ